MLISISKENKIRVIHEKDPIIKHVPHTGADLFAVIDDLLSIDWLRVYHYAQAQASKKPVRDNNLHDLMRRANEPLWNLLSFHAYLRHSESLQKHRSTNPVSEVTYELLRKQYYSFERGLRKASGYRFDNIILLLNLDGCLDDANIAACQSLFSESYPKVQIFSPFSAALNTSQNFIDECFHSNCEMIVYDIFCHMYPEDDSSYLLSDAKHRCRSLFKHFSTDKEENISKNKRSHYSLTDFTNDFFSLYEYDDGLENAFMYSDGQPGRRSRHPKDQKDASREIGILLRLLHSQKFYALLKEEYENESRSPTYRQKKLLCADFLAADLENPFECYQYIKFCYEKYAIQADNIYNIPEQSSVAAFLCLYARAYAGISFKRCRICGHYFVKSKEDKRQDKCGRCEHLIKTDANLSAFDKLESRVHSKYYTGISRVKNPSPNASSDSSATLSQWLADYDQAEIISRYEAMMAQFWDMLDNIALFRAQVCVCRGYDEMRNVYQSDYQIDLSDRMNVEKSLIPNPLRGVLADGCSLETLYGEQDRAFNFKALYEKYLAPTHDGFFSYFKECAEAEDEEQIDEANRRLRSGFAEVCAAFEAEHCDTGELRRLQQELLDVMVPES